MENEQQAVVGSVDELVDPGSGKDRGKLFNDLCEEGNIHEGILNPSFLVLGVSRYAQDLVHLREHAHILKQGQGELLIAQQILQIRGG